ncbi:MAG: transketolase family protein [Myxococcales bacterium]|nr:MAG: transketolase family protein [Myxococcales bacterium]
MDLTRQGFADALVELGHETDNVVALDADLSCSVLSAPFAKQFPHRQFNLGIAEQSMAATAAGLSAMGFRVFIASYAMFAAGRAWEIVRQQVSYGEANVVVVGAHGGVSVGKDGPTHQCCEDLALMRVLPKMKVVVPCDYWETFKTVKYAGKTTGPFYFRMGREKVPVVTGKDDPWELGKANTFAEGTDGTIIACGLMVALALEAREMLERDGIRPRVVNMHTIKPLDVAAIEKAIDETGAIVTAEEHSIIGGLGSAVAEAVVQSGKPVPMRFVGVEDRYLESGAMNDLLKQAGLTSEHIAAEVRTVLARRR